MRKIILLVDNNLDFLETYTRLLESKGYTVYPAASIQEAERAIRERNLHLAILDNRMEDDNDPNDYSGTLLARKEAYRNLPKIMLTNYPSYMDVREILPRHVVNYVGKGEPLQKLFEAIEKAFEGEIQINPDLVVHTPAGEALAPLNLASYILQESDPALISERTAELEDLLHKLFARYEQVTLSRLLWQANQRIALCVSAYLGDKVEEFVLTCGLSQVIEEEYTRFAETAPSEFSRVRARLVAHSVHFSAHAWSLSGASLESARRFSDFYQENNASQIRSALENLYRATLASWQRQNVGREQAPFDTWMAAIGEGGEIISQARLEMAAGALANEAQEQRLPVTIRVGGGLHFEFPSRKRLDCPSPLSALAGQTSLRQVVIAQTLGGIHPDTVLVDAKQQTWPTDFYRAGRAPLYIDFISLENHIRFQLGGSSNLVSLFDFEKQLAACASLCETIPTGNVEPDCRKALSAILDVRRLAAECGSDDAGLYFSGLLALTLHELARFDPAIRCTRSELVGWLHRLMFAALLAHRLADIQAPRAAVEGSPKPAGMSIDPKKHEVLVDGRQVELTLTEFELLEYLWRNKGKVCDYEALLHDVFGYGKVDRGAKKVLRTHILRLREKIGPGEKEKFIHNVYGRGYKLADS